VVLEFPDGTRVWRTAAGGPVRHESTLGGSLGRAGMERGMYSAGKHGNLPLEPGLRLKPAESPAEVWNFDESPSNVTISPGQGVVTTAPEVAAGFLRSQVAALRRILAKPFSHADISVLRQLWDDAARPGDAAILNQANSRNLFDLQRNRFWRRVAADPTARKLFTDAGCQFAGGAPYLVVRGDRIVVTIDHIVERQLNPQLALTASNLRLAFSRENSVVLRLLNQLDPFLN
jgi:hypothetical protein